MSAAITYTQETIEPTLQHGNMWSLKSYCVPIDVILLILSAPV